MRTLTLLGILAGLVFLGGCATVTRSAEENRMQWRAVTEMDMRQLADDWNLLWLNDRQSRLTRWQTR